MTKYKEEMYWGFLFLIILMTGCDPGYGYIRKIKNESFKEVAVIQIKQTAAGTYFNDTVYIKSGQEYIVDQAGGLGKLIQQTCAFTRMRDSIIVVEKNLWKVLKKDFYNEQSWQSTYSSKTMYSNQSCSSTITNNDLP